MNNMTQKRVIGIGETVLDILFKNDQPQKAVPGGSTFNSIVSLGRAGVPCAMLTEVGGDHVGDIICNFLVDNGVSSEYVCRHENAKSHITLAFLNEHNDAQYFTKTMHQFGWTGMCLNWEKRTWCFSVRSSPSTLPYGLSWAVCCVLHTRRVHGSIMT